MPSRSRTAATATGFFFLEDISLLERLSALFPLSDYPTLKIQNKEHLPEGKAAVPSLFGDALVGQIFPVAEIRENLRHASRRLYRASIRQSAMIKSFAPWAVFIQYAQNYHTTFTQYANHLVPNSRSHASHDRICAASWGVDYIKHCKH